MYLYVPLLKITGGCEKSSCKETVLNSDFPNLFDHMENICFFQNKLYFTKKKKNWNTALVYLASFVLEIHSSYKTNQRIR